LIDAQDIATAVSAVIALNPRATRESDIKPARPTQIALRLGSGNFDFAGAVVFVVGSFMA